MGADPPFYCRDVSIRKLGVTSVIKILLGKGPNLNRPCIRITCGCTHSCDCTWTRHVGGCTLHCRRGRRWERSAHPLYMLTHGRNIASRVAEAVVVLRVVALWVSSVVTFACSREEQADRLLVVKKTREEAHVCSKVTCPLMCVVISEITERRDPFQENGRFGQFTTR